MNREVMAKLRGKMKAAELSHCVAELSSRTAELNHNVMQRRKAKLIRMGEAGWEMARGKAKQGVSQKLMQLQRGRAKLNKMGDAGWEMQRGWAKPREMLEMPELNSNTAESRAKLSRRKG